MRGGIQLTVCLVLLELLLPACTLRCDRTPEGHVSPKIPADNRFQLKISGSPEKYVPGEGYTISLQGLRNHGQVAQKFTGFMLVVEPQSFMPLRVLSPRDVTTRPVGTFTLYGDTLTKFSQSCPNMVTHTSSMPKSEIQVRWTAPPPGSGCVIFRATVIEHRDVWYQDDGPLSKMLCEEEQESHDSQPEILDTCCACDEAKYEVTFEGLWSRHTHPKDFPSNSWLTRFSDVIGASHSNKYRFWEYGGLASDGLAQVAERGATRMLEAELKAESAHIRTIIKARGISYPNVTGKTFAVFRVDKEHHLMSLVSMIEPSPDWIVGVASLELCLRNCSWVESKVLNLYPWDAGTDSGVTYISPDQQTYPREKIRRITSSFPNDPRSPFYDQTGAEMKPLARLYLMRQRLYEKTCEEEPMGTNECQLTDWSEWGPCSASCGPGYKHRQRQYVHRSQGQNCPRVPLTNKKSCVARQCMFPGQPTPEPVDPLCEKSEWADWSRCLPVDQTCTRGTQKRYRQVRPRDINKRKYCLKVPTEEERECRPSMSPAVCPKNTRNNQIYRDAQSSTCCGENGTSGEEGGENGEEENVEEEKEEGEGDEGGEGEGENAEDQEPTGECAMTKWSMWSPCSASCGVGETRRSRWLLNPAEEEEEVPEPRAEYRRYRRYAEADTDTDYGNYDEATEENVPQIIASEYAEGPCSIYKTVEVAACNGTYATCHLPPDVAREICALPPHPGRCPGPIVSRWYYDPNMEDCSEFEWSGCRGNKNRFITREECRVACQAYTEGGSQEAEDETTTEGTIIDGLDVGDQTRGESEENVAEGTEKPVRNCKFSKWSEWSKCNAACNQQGFKVRTRHIEIHARNGGRDCIGKTRKQKKCTRRCKHDEEDEEEEEEENEERRGNQHRHRKSGCQYTEWTEWTECTATCGYSAMRQRTRHVTAGDPSVCDDRIRKRTCNVGSCPK